MAVRVGTLNINLAVNLEAFQRGLRQAERDFNRAANNFNSIGKTLTSAVTAPLLAVGTAATKIGADFDQSFSRMNGLLNASTKEVAQYRAGVLAMAGEVTKAPQELAKALETVVDAGFSGAQALDVLRVSAKASAAGLGETERIADIVTTTLNVYKKENLSAAKATGILVAAAREGRGPFQDMIPVFGSLGPVSSELGVKFSEVAGAIAAMTAKGLTATESGTALRSVFTALLRPSADAQRALSEVGLSAEGLRKMIREAGLLSALERLQTAFGGNADALTRVFPGAKSFAGVLALLGSAGGEAQKVFETMSKSGVADLDRAFGAIDPKTRAWNSALAELQVVFIKVSDSVQQLAIPAMRALAGVLTKVSEGLDGMDKDSKNLLLVAAAMAAILGPLALGFGALFKALAAGAGILKTILALAIPFFSTLSVGVILTAAVTTGAAFLIVSKWEWIRDSMTKVMDTIEAAVSRFTQSFARYLYGLDGAVGQIFGNIMAKMLMGFVLPTQTAMTKANNSVELLSAGWSKSFDTMAAKAGEMATKLLGSLQGAFPAIVGHTEGARAATEALGDAQTVMAEKTVTAWQQIKDTVVSGADTLEEVFISLKGTMSDTGAAMFNTMTRMAQESARSAGAMTAAFATGRMHISEYVREMIFEIGKLIAKILLLKALTMAGFGGPFGAGLVGGLFGGFAAGGRPPVGVPSVVGERGPELFVPDTSGTIVPNDRLASFGGGGGQKIEVHQHVTLQGIDYGSQEAARRTALSLKDLMRSGAEEGVSLALQSKTVADQNEGRAV